VFLCTIGSAEPCHKVRCYLALYLSIRITLSSYSFLGLVTLYLCSCVKKVVVLDQNCYCYPCNIKIIQI
jgi:hypothetical protein